MTPRGSLVEDVQLVEKVEGGEHGKVGVTLVRGGPTEDGKETVTRVARQVAAITLDTSPQRF